MDRRKHFTEHVDCDRAERANRWLFRVHDVRAAGNAAAASAAFLALTSSRIGRYRIIR
jgi:hypothetical protein